jgi:hypothetical protein
MKSLIREKLKGFFGLTAIQDAVRNNRLVTNDNFAYQLIRQYCPVNSYFPFTSFSLSPATIVHIMNDILINRRKRIVELGSGSSTLVLASFLKSIDKDIEFVSIESDANWASLISSQLRDNSSEKFVKVVTAELKMNNDGTFWFDKEKLDIFFSSNVGKIDLLIVDAPPASHHPLIRQHALPFFKTLMADSYAVFLDDSSRKGESAIVNEWAVSYALTTRNYLRYSYLYNGFSYVSEPIYSVNV